MTTAETEHKIRRLDNDVHAIYDMLGDIQKTQRDHGAHFKDLSAGQGRIWATLARHGNRLNEHGVLLEEIGAAQTAIQATLTRHGHRLDEQGAKLDEHSVKLDEHSAKLDEHSLKLDDHTAKLDTIIDLLRGGRPKENAARLS